MKIVASNGALALIIATTGGVGDITKTKDMSCHTHCVARPKARRNLSGQHRGWDSTCAGRHPTDHRDYQKAEKCRNFDFYGVGEALSEDGGTVTKVDLANRV